METHGTCVDETNSYSCDCADGFTGNRCESDVDECSSDPCQHLGTCADEINQFTCSCPTRYEGITCETGNNYNSFTFKIYVNE